MTLISQDTNVHTFNNGTGAQVDDGNLRGLVCCLITLPFSQTHDETLEYTVMIHTSSTHSPTTKNSPSSVNKIA